MTEKELMDSTRGFLPVMDPVECLPSDYTEWEEVGLELPKLLVAGRVPHIVKSLPQLNPDNLSAQADLERAMLLLSFLGHAYVWGGDDIPQQLPAAIAVPWYKIATKLQRLPVLSYASYALHNWRRLDKKQDVALGNIVLLQNFLGGLDEEWFVLVHVEIEREAAPALQQCFPLQDCVECRAVEEVISHLEIVADALAKMCKTLDRMTEHCDPYIYYNRVRPYIHGWKDNPALPRGLIYEGVTAYQNQPQSFRGETGAQSSIIPTFDALFGVVHENDPLRIYLNEMRSYMPFEHRQFLEAVERRGPIRSFVSQHCAQQPKLRDLYNICLESISYFRQTHLRFAAQYIQKQSQTSIANPTGVGTGGTPFMDYLRKHKDETLKFLI